MFTGLIELTGTVAAYRSHRITICSPALAPRLNAGDSIAVNGVCLTALDISATHFSADLAQETIERTTLSRLAAESLVNLELPTPAGSPMGGHVVQGHVDGVALLLALDPIDASSISTTDWRLRLRLPEKLVRYVVPQGSLTVEGISLTVADITGDVVSIAIIPHTYKSTTLHTLLPGTPINIEVDVLAKYASQQKTPPAPTWHVTEEYLLANGY
jgi:riboflavin synthase